MRVLLNKYDPLYSPATEWGSVPAAPATIGPQMGSSGPLPIVLGAAIAFGCVSIVVFLTVIVRISCSRARVNYLAEAVIQENTQQRASAAANNNNGGGSATTAAAAAAPSRTFRPSENKNKTPPRVPVVIIEPDSFVAIAYSLGRDGTATTTPTTPVSEIVPLWRTPTVSRLSAEIQAAEATNICENKSSDVIDP